MRKFLTVLFISLFAFAVSAQSDYAKKGVIDLAGTISFTSSTSVANGETADESLTQFAFQPLIGYFVIDGLELALVPQISTASYGDNSQTSMHIFFAPAYNFTTNGTAYPYVAGLIGYSSISDDDDTYSGVSYGGAAGVKVSVTEGAMVNVGVQYLMITTNPEDADERYGSNELGITAGFLVWFN